MLHEKNNINILLLGAGNRVSFCEYLIEAGKVYNKEVNIFSVEIKDPVPISKYATILKGERWYSPGFAQSIIDVCVSNYIDFVIPLMDDATVALSKHREIINYTADTQCIVSDSLLCEIFLDKKKSEDWFYSKKIQIPRMPKDDICYPCIIKNKTGYGSRDQAILNSSEEFCSFIHDKNILDYITQPYIEGTEYTIDAYVTKEGIVHGAVSRIRVETVNGEVSRGLTKKEPVLLKEVERILSLGGFRGPITLQAIKAEDGSGWYFIEINPRFGGGCIQSFKAGANFAQTLIAEYSGEDLPDCSDWQEGLLMMRANQEIWYNE